MARCILPVALSYAAVALSTPGCRNHPHGSGQTPAAPLYLRFSDITAKAGIAFRHVTGADGRFRFPEAEPPGCAFLDYDGDDRPDIFITNGRHWPDGPNRNVRTTPALYRNRGDGRFEDVTRQAGLDVPMYGMGAVAGDYDNDGRQDLYVSCLEGPGRLFHNEGGRFRDVTAAAGIETADRWGSAALWIDYDLDGFLDLFAAGYCRWSPAADRVCMPFGERSYCTPAVYDGEPPRLYRNLRNGRFEDVSVKAGLAGLPGKTLGAALLDFNGDSRPDIVLANDLEPTVLLRNNGDGAFTDVALESGIALAESGRPRSGMGIDAADLDGSGRESVVISNFTGEGLSLFRNLGGGTFEDVSVTTGLTATSIDRMGWGLFFFDADLDGDRDLLVANGHLYPNVARRRPNITYAESALLYLNHGEWRLEEIGARCGDLAKPVVARGAGCADIDGDGDLDVLIAVNGGAPLLLRNDLASGARWVRIRLVGTRSNRDGIGARVEIEANSRRQTFRVRSGSSYMSDLERTLTVGLGSAKSASRIAVVWPGGHVDRYVDIEAGALLVITEGRDARAYPAGDRTTPPKVYARQ